ncbi:TlpA family protein disulfide reductase [Nostoc sp. UHCC 0870]|uniref:TlpA family protein disulfide reductase n=1 Tax=Nostoc sp. UHCC 0870 TaxID=2914041 RepID=UPI001EDE9038|nr:thioredoxin family protein [Nostoc sp. UHCC 0870]UKO98650.1 thioredoxin family protein [Nostoc sp. UHCC 0870]
MYKYNKFFLSLLCLSGLVLTVSCSPPKSDNIAQNQASSTAKVAQTDPCAGKNPCAAKDAAKLTSVGNPLAQELQGKPVLVDVFATWCAGCKNIAPTLSQLKQEYSGKVNFVVLDVTDKAKLQETQAQAEKLGLGKFLEANKSQTSTVAIVDPATGNILTIFKNNPNKADYTKILDSALANI